MSNTVTIKFEVEKETKRTFRFKEVSNDLGDAPVIRTLYVQKTALKVLAISDVIPSELTLTLEVTR